MVRGAIPIPVLNAFTGVLEAEVELRAGAMYERREISALHAEESFATRWYRLCNERGVESTEQFWHACVFGRPLYRLWTHPAIVDVVESLIGPEVQVSGDYILRPRLPAQSSAVLPWHQDSGYMEDTGQHHWPTVWVPLVPVAKENGAMQFIPGTHSLPVQEHAKRQTEVSDYPTPSFDPAEGQEVVMPEMVPGDFVIFHNHVFHRSTHGTARSIRWSVDFRFSPAGTQVGEHLWFHGMRHVVRSASDPRQVPSWNEVVAMWDQSEQKIRNP